MIEYEKNGKYIRVDFLKDEDVNSPGYLAFLNSDEFRAFKHAKPGEVLSKRHLGRMAMYRALYEQKTVVATIDGEIVGQSCSLKNYAIVHGKRVEWWWSVDTFLMTACRGLGIGKGLQKVLHDELPNFSSAWYTPINGIVKEKCGAHGIFDIWFNYYPVSSAITVFGDLCFRKLFKCPIPVRLNVPYLYCSVNSVFTDTKLKGYQVTEIPYERLGEKESAFMEKALAKKDFHIERSVEFLQWRYKNLKAGYHMLEITKEGKQEAIIAFSNIYNSGFDAAPIKGVSIYDMVISSESKLTERRLLLYIARWYRRRGEKFDGFQMLRRVKYLGRMCYPFHACPVLSTIEGEYKDGYLTLADQDMDQI